MTFKALRGPKPSTRLSSSGALAGSFARALGRGARALSRGSLSSITGFSESLKAPRSGRGVLSPRFPEFHSLIDIDAIPIELGLGAQIARNFLSLNFEPTCLASMARVVQSFALFAGTHPPACGFLSNVVRARPLGPNEVLVHEGPTLVIRGFGPFLYTLRESGSSYFVDQELSQGHAPCTGADCTADLDDRTRRDLCIL